MLEIYTVSLRVVRAVSAMEGRVRARNTGLADQLVRACISMPLNIAEGAGQRNGNRTQRYLTALGSARETEAALDVACAVGVIDGVDAQLKRDLDHVIGVLVSVTRRAR